MIGIRMKLQEHNTLAKFFKSVSEFSSQQKSIEEFAAYVIRHFDLLEDPKQADGDVHIPASLVPDLGNQAAQAHFKKIMCSKSNNDIGITKAYKPSSSFIDSDKINEMFSSVMADKEEKPVEPRSQTVVNPNAPRKIVAQPKKTLEDIKNITRKIDEDFLKNLNTILVDNEDSKNQIDSALCDSIKLTTERLEKTLDSDPVADIVGETIQHAVVLDAKKTAAEHINEVEHRADEKLSEEFISNLDDLLSHPEKVVSPAEAKAKRIRDISFKSTKKPQPVAKKKVKAKLVKPAAKKTVVKKAASKKSARK